MNHEEIEVYNLIYDLHYISGCRKFDSTFEHKNRDEFETINISDYLKYNNGQICVLRDLCDYIDNFTHSSLIYDIFTVYVSGRKSGIIFEKISFLNATNKSL